jgi:polygalacturonase
MFPNNNKVENTVVDTRSAVRRKLLTSLLAGSGALVLAACGGGGSDSSNLDAVADRSRGGGSSRPASSASPASSAPASAPAPASSDSTAGTVLDTSFGGKGDGTTNDRAALQAAIDGSVGQILLITGQSRIDTTGLTLRTNSHIRFAPGASIKLLSHNVQIYQMFRL